MALHYAPVNANAMRLYSVLINHGADPSAEDSRGHNPQYYIDHVDEILIPEWSNKWSNMIAAQSPEPRRKKSERSTAAKERNALAKTIANAAKSARQKKREGKLFANCFFAFYKNAFKKKTRICAFTLLLTIK